MLDMTCGFVKRMLIVVVSTVSFVVSPIYANPEVEPVKLSHSIAKYLDKGEPYLRLGALFVAKAFPELNPLSKFPGIDYLKSVCMPLLPNGEALSSGGNADTCKNNLCEELKCAFAKTIVSELIYQYKEFVDYVPDPAEEVENPNARGWEEEFKKFCNDFVELTVEKSGCLTKAWRSSASLEEFYKTVDKTVVGASEKLLVQKMLPSVIKGLTKSEDFRDWADIDGKDGKAKIASMLAIALVLSKAKSGKSSYVHTTDIINKLAVAEFKERKLENFFDKIDVDHRRAFVDEVISNYLGFYAEYFWGYDDYNKSLLCKIPSKTLHYSGKALRATASLGRYVASKLGIGA